MQPPLRPPGIPPIPEAQQEEEPESSAAAYSNPFEAEEAAGPSSAASASAHSHQSHDSLQNLQQQPDPQAQQLQSQEELFTPLNTARPETITTPAAAAPSLPVRSSSVSSMASPRELTHVDSHSSSDSANANSVAIKQSKEQSRQLLEKASQKLASLLVNANEKNFDASRRPGNPVVRRAPQVPVMHRTYIHTCIAHTYIHTYVCTYMQQRASHAVRQCTTTCSLSLQDVNVRSCCSVRSQTMRLSC